MQPWYFTWALTVAAVLLVRPRAMFLVATASISLTLLTRPMGSSLEASAYIPAVLAAALAARSLLGPVVHRAVEREPAAGPAELGRRPTGYCRQLNAQHGKTFYLATGLLPSRPAPARARAVRLRPLRRRPRRPARVGSPRPAGWPTLGRRTRRGLAGGPPAANPVVRAVAAHGAPNTTSSTAT